MFYIHDRRGLERIYSEELLRSLRGQREVEGVRAIRPLSPSLKEAAIPERYPDKKERERPNPYAQLDQPQEQREPAIVAKQIMSSPVITLTSKQSISEAQKLFKEHRFRHIPVLAADSRLIGIISDRDVLALPPEHQLIESVMSTPVLSARPETELRKIAGIMFHERIGAIPIVAEDEKLAGILTRSDILRTLLNQVPLELWL